MLCPKCGALLPSEANFCSKCGSPLTCANCNTKVTSEDNFCPKCGTPLLEKLVSTEQKNQALASVVNPAGPTKKIKLGPIGVGGWLLFLVMALMLLWPVLAMGQLFNYFKLVEQQYPDLTSIASYGTFKFWVWATLLISIAISFYGGLILSTSRNWSAVKRAIAVLWVIGPLESIVMTIIIPLMVFGKLGATDSEIISRLFLSAGLVSIWTAYLLKSKRVRNTYGFKKSL